MSYKFSPALEKKFEWLKSRYPVQDAVLIPLLHFVQNEVGYLSLDAMEHVAEKMNISPARVKEVASFYSLFRFEAGGKYVLQVCHNLTCYLKGSDQLLEWMEKNMELDDSGNSKDGVFRVERVECLASCGTAPVIQANNWDYFEELNLEKLQKIVEALRAGKWACASYEDRIQEGSVA
ncbi:NAD(P)H-dependent oxidoreductase subunit E [bacterium]|nr:NAD(P)H-dependent oxidoreductase subunit E [bacterium]